MTARTSKRKTAAKTAGSGSKSRKSSSNRAVPLAPPGAQTAGLEVPEPVRKAGWAIVGLGGLTVEEVLPAFADTTRSRLAALVSGHPDKTRQLADVYGLNDDALYTYDTFDTIESNDAIDVVYIVLPNNMHAEYTVRALEAGKHVLCEKPMAMNSKECRRMIDAARAADRKLMIAYRLHYEPFTRKLIEMCEARELGAIKAIATCNGQVTKAPNIRLSKKLGGGPLQDTGIYCINAAGYVTGEQPISVTARAWQPKDDPSFREVPESVTFTLHYASGLLAHCDTSFGVSESRYLRVQCEQGVIDFDMAYAYRGQRLRVKRGRADDGGASDEELVFRPVDHFAAEMDHFSGCVVDGTDPHTPGEMGLADVRVIEAIEKAVKSGATVDVVSAKGRPRSPKRGGARR